ncbi:MAG: HD domain-containing protein [Verrucomicrobiota bacterium]
MSANLYEHMLKEANDYMQKIELEPEHVLQVHALATSLFDQSKKIHRFSTRERKILEAAALLHDIGWSQSPTGKKHHKISAQMILEHEWHSTNIQDVILIAQIARYHRKALPKVKHKAFQSLSPNDQKIVTINAALLRIADALDRSHSSLISEIFFNLSEETWTLTAVSSTNCANEISAFQKKSNLFNQYFKTNLKLEFKIPDHHPYSSRKRA